MLSLSVTDVIVIFRTSTGTFDALRGRYFPGGPTPPEGMDADMMFKVIDHLHHKQDGHDFKDVHNVQNVDVLRSR